MYIKRHILKHLKLYDSLTGSCVPLLGSFKGYLAHCCEGWITRSIQVLNQELDTIGDNAAKQRVSWENYKQASFNKLISFNKYVLT